MSPTDPIKPLISTDFFADPSGRVFNNKLYIYPSHDRRGSIPDDDNGSQYDMADYHVLSMETVGGEVRDHGKIFGVEDVEWAERQLWAPDCGFKNGKYYFYFPARDYDGIFRIGVAVGENPEGPFVPEKKAIEGSHSIDPAVLVDEDGEAYLYFGGIWGGQLQCWRSPTTFDKSAYPSMEAQGSEPALLPRVAKLSPDMLSFATPPQDLIINDIDGSPIPASDHSKRFFEAAWMHRHGGKYYFSYSTGDTHYIVYAIGEHPLGPFTYAGRILEPVEGWTTHHSIVEFGGKWWICYHDVSVSGENHLRSAKMREVVYDEEGRISLKDAQ